MKKIALLLVISIFFSLFPVMSYAEESIPLYAEITDLNKGEIVVSVYGDSLKKLVSLNLQLKYDTSVFCYKSGTTASYYDETAEDYADNFSGLWDFGELADGSGCTGVMISYDGSTRSGRVKICEFVLGLTGRRIDETKLLLNVNELVTEDGDFLNDIYSITAVTQKSFSVNYEDLFGYAVTDGVSEISDCYYNANCITIPEEIGGGRVNELKLSENLDCAFAIIPENVSVIGESTLNPETLIICPASCTAESFAKNNGMKYFTYKNVTIRPDNLTVITEKQKICDISVFTDGNAQYSSTPSYSCGETLYGTESKIDLINGENYLTFTLCIKGDLNGDSLADILDCVLCERAVNNRTDLNEYQTISADLNEDDNLTVEDYSAVVNKVLNNA